MRLAPQSSGGSRNEKAHGSVVVPSSIATALEQEAALAALYASIEWVETPREFAARLVEATEESAT